MSRRNGELSLSLIIALLFSSCIKQEPAPPAGFETVIPGDSIVFAVIGDYGNTSLGEEVVSNLVKSWDPDFIITTGDNNYQKGLMSEMKQNISDFYGDYIYNFDAPEEYRCNGIAFEEKINRFFPSPGNHDAYNVNGLQPYLDFFTLPQKEVYYSFSWGPVQFFSLNSLENNMMEQYEWMLEQIEESDLPFTIVYFHHPPYSPGDHGNNKKMQLDYHSPGIDLVLSGHDHIYSRISRHDEPGLYYIISGAGGKILYDSESNPLPETEFDSFSYDDEYGALKITATNKMLTAEYYGIASWKNKIDSISIFPN